MVIDSIYGSDMFIDQLTYPIDSKMDNCVVNVNDNVTIEVSNYDLAKKLIDSEYDTKMSIIENMKPDEEQMELNEERRKKLMELKRKLNDDYLDREEKMRLIDEYLSSDYVIDDAICNIHHIV